MCDVLRITVSPFSKRFYNVNITNNDAFQFQKSLCLIETIPYLLIINAVVRGLNVASKC